MPDIQHNPRSSSAGGINGDTSVTRPANHSVSKRTRSPTSTAGQIIQMSSNTTEDDTDREEQAKAKRMARFKTELELVESERGDSTPYGQNVTKGRVSSIKTDRSAAENLKFSGDFPSGSAENQDYDNEDLQSSKSERGERERKGDLDLYERLDGNRNQTTKMLAVKKYNRTAEREAERIRPLPILEKTMDYLLGLLDLPYDERFLSLYNFMWDRMRAIRMDLRMQHIFNNRAITMLEQMIRFHIIAMHELCEFSKGEGFSEGFDAHLNIEQMNKTSVELFQLYDDHRKRGIFIPTEKEFRGYYALLKLDKHPGYKVDPAELSLDLAKMTAEIRQTLEVLFARDHSFVMQGKRAIFKHGEDIESLLEYHGFVIKEFEEPYMVKEGPFLNNEKDYSTRCSALVHRKKSSTIMEDVLSSHQVITLSSEPMKELPSDKHRKNKHTAVQPMQTKSPLVSDGKMDIETVSSSISSTVAESVPEKSKSMQVQAEFGTSKSRQSFTDTHHRVSADSPSAFASFQSPSMLEQPSPVTPKHVSFIADAGQLSYKDSLLSLPVQQSESTVKSTYFGLARQKSFEGPVKSSPEKLLHSELKPIQPEVSASIPTLTFPASEAESSFISTIPDGVFMTREEFNDVQQKVDDEVADNYDEEVAEAKLRLLLRIWRRRSLRKKHIREQNRLAATAALSSLYLGPPIWQYQYKSTLRQKLNIDQTMNERYERYQLSLARLNVSDLVASRLAEKHENSNCICWKVILFSWMQHGRSNLDGRSPVSHFSLDEWLHNKLIPARKEEADEDLVISAPGLSVWRKWAFDQFGDFRGYFSVVKDTHSGTFEKTLVGANAILFPVSETFPWDIQKTQLNNLVTSLPAGSCIPLLITCGSAEETFAHFSCSLVEKLGLNELDKSRISSFTVICLNEGHGQFDGYLSDQQLKEGLTWLASASCSQPALSCVTIRELIFLHLNSFLDALDLIGDKVGPYRCISAFNQALDQSINSIITAANANPTGWPCPEIFLLDDSTSEFRVVKKFLPALGWSSPEEIEPLVSALRKCKLPSVFDDISWLYSDCSSEKDIEDKKQLLQECLIRYLAHSSSMLNLTMAVKEACLMVQKYTKLELHDTGFKMIPSWVLIFRRVFNWQLNSSASFSQKVYVLEQSLTACSPSNLDKMEIEVPESHYVDHPMLDEMVEVSCSPIVSKRVKSSPKSFQKVAAIASGENTSGDISHNPLVEEPNQYSEIQVLDNPDFYARKNGMPLVPEDDKKADRLSLLLDQCNILQDDIEKRLSIYF
ncbi:SAC3 family protein B [Bienertia sinuspersici]